MKTEHNQFQRAFQRYLWMPFYGFAILCMRCSDWICRLLQKINIVTQFQLAFILHKFTDLNHVGNVVVSNKLRTRCCKCIGICLCTTFKLALSTKHMMVEVTVDLIRNYGLKSLPYKSNHIYYNTIKSLPCYHHFLQIREL